MPGGIIQLVTYGTQDIFLTGSPQITFFKLVYKRYTNFSIEAVEQKFNGYIDFDSTVSLSLDKNGDLVNRMYLQVILPEIHLLKKDLNPNYIPPNSNLLSCLNDDNLEVFRPDDLEFAFKTRDKKNAQLALYLYEIYINYIVKNIYVYSKQQLDENVDLDTSNVNGKFPKKSFANNLLNSDKFTYIVISEQDELTKAKSDIMKQCYIDLFELTNIEKQFLDTYSEQYKYDYDYYLNTLLKKLFTVNNGIKVPEILLEKLDLKKIILNFFNNTINNTFTDEERTKIFNELLDQWYIDAKESLVFLNKEYVNSCKNLDIISSSYVKFAWIKRIGHFILDFIEIYIGGKRIDKHYNHWLNIWYELSKNVYQDNNYNKMIGNIDILTTFDNNLKPEYKLYIPLQFWFCRYNGLALPLVALRYHDVKINVKFNKLEKCSYLEEGYSYFEKINIKDASLFVDYIYLDSSERKRFASASHEYLIDQVQLEEFKEIISPNITSKLNFVHPTKEVIWTIQSDKYLLNNNFYNKLLNPSNYTNNDNNEGNPLIDAIIELNSHIRVQRLDGNYFNYVQPYQHHSNTPSDGINLYSFAIEPELQQPSGSINFSRIDSIIFHLTFNEEMFNDNYNKTIRFYALNYNVLRIMSGMGGLAFES